MDFCARLTDEMTDSEILGYVYYIAKEGIHVGENLRLPADGAYTNERINNMAVLVPNLQKNNEILKKALYPDQTTENSTEQH